MAEEHELEMAVTGAVRSLTRNATIVDGTITAVDADPTNPDSTYTCTVEVGGTAYFSVPLRVLTSNQAAFLLVPAENSDCLLTFRDGNDGRPQIYDLQEIQDIFISPLGKTTYNGGKQGGVPLVVPLTQALQSIQNDINNLKTVFSSWTPVPNDGGAALKAAAGAWFTKQLPVTQQTDIANTLIVQ